MQRNLIKNLRLIIAFALLAAWTIFIWHNSMEPANISGGKSLRITELINQCLNLSLTDHIIRKFAHFCEYGLEGVFATVFFYQIKKPISRSGIILILIGFIIAFIDESIQFFTPGRSCQLSDMLLDTAGYACGYFAIKVIHLLITARSHRPS